MKRALSWPSATGFIGGGRALSPDRQPVGIVALRSPDAPVEEETPEPARIGRPEPA
jgi:hypothetical protein